MSAASTGAGRPDGIRLRDATSADWAAIGELHAASWSASYRGAFDDAYLDGPVFQERAERWQRRIANGVPSRLVVVVAEEPGGQLAGFCCIVLGHDPDGGGLIDNVHVRPGGTRRRLGRDLLREAAARVAEGPDRDRSLRLTVLEDNARAIGAYEAWGGRLAWRGFDPAPDGRSHPVRCYDWANAAALLAGLAAAT